MTTRSGQPLAQRPAELEALLALFVAEGVRSYIEVGARWGDTFARVAETLAPGATLVAVDLPGGPWGASDSRPVLENAARYAQSLGHDVTLLFGPSAAPATVAAVRAIRPRYDAVLIDADHAEAAVRADWLAYGPLARLVAFHDIAPLPENRRIEVPRVFGPLSTTHRSRTFIDAAHPGMGIGVLWTEA